MDSIHDQANTSQISAGLGEFDQELGYLLLMAAIILFR